jgi:hypothetical protein
VTEEIGQVAGRASEHQQRGRGRPGQGLRVAGQVPA